jgi:hypothetical protein
MLLTVPARRDPAARGAPRRPAARHDLTDAAGDSPLSVMRDGTRLLRRTSMLPSFLPGRHRGSFLAPREQPPRRTEQRARWRTGPTVDLVAVSAIPRRVCRSSAYCALRPGLLAVEPACPPHYSSAVRSRRTRVAVARVLGALSSPAAAARGRRGPPRGREGPRPRSASTLAGSHRCHGRRRGCGGCCGRTRSA